jgi:solute carrier family 25 uncoupling protein 27
LLLLLLLLLLLRAQRPGLAARSDSHPCDEVPLAVLGKFLFVSFSAPSRRPPITMYAALQSMYNTKAAPLATMSTGPAPNSPAEWAQKFALTGCAAMLAESATFPIDMTKTRMQLFGQGTTNKARAGFFETMKNTVKGEGIGGLYTGISPAVIRHIPYTGSRIGLYEFLRGFFIVEGEKPGFLTRLCLGFASGGTAQAIAVPCDLVKVRMMGDGLRVLKGEIAAPRYTGFVDAISKITKETGVKGLYAGSIPAVQRAAFVNLGELATYDSAKDMWLRTGWVEDNIYCHVLSAVCSGFFASLCSTPFDVAKTRIMNQGKEKIYSGTFDCLRKTATAEGPLALYKGFLPGWGRLGPWQLVFWVSYEQLRRLTGIGTF